MTDRERATRNALIAELEGANWMRWGLSRHEKKHLREAYDPAFVEWRRADLERWARYVPDWAVLAVIVALIAATLFTSWSMLPTICIAFALAGLTAKRRWELTIYRSLSALSTAPRCAGTS